MRDKAISALDPCDERRLGQDSADVDRENRFDAHFPEWGFLFLHLTRNPELGQRHHQPLHPPNQDRGACYVHPRESGAESNVQKNAPD